jgi:2-dehydro-3-deoxyphosphogluconate aldolase/(4S)-4-hydroxy-2-oxoglutarate aldolase
MNREQGLKQVENTRIVTIVRGVEKQHILPLAEALLAGGITVVEITLNTPGAPEMIGQLQQAYGDRMYIGAGTVLDVNDVNIALEAGASFIVTPNTDEAVIQRCVEVGVPIYPGAMTPTEIVRAWKAGATAVKIFPSASLGIGYLKELQGPLNHIPIIAVGGVSVDNIQEFIRIGCHAVGIGGSLINLKEIQAGNFAWITSKAKALTDQTIPAQQ